MILIPAIDLKDHKVVRLSQGRANQAKIYSDSILETAARWIDQGAKRLHLVDLNGAFAGKPFHDQDIARIAEKFPGTEIEVGGGIRDVEAIQRYLDSGVSYCILGTAAIKDPGLVRVACQRFPHKIILGIDARDGLVATEGWDDVSTEDALVVSQGFGDEALESIIYTDIAKDGMLSGMNFEHIYRMRGCGIPVIASGGLTTLADIARLKSMGGIHGVIAGKAIYEGRFTVAEAIEVIDAP